MPNQLEIDYFNIGNWVSKKFYYHKTSTFKRVRNMQINSGEIWTCDLGFNVGEEKNKLRPILIVSNNNINRTGKVIVLTITDAKGKVNAYNLPQHNSWFLLYSNTLDPNSMFTLGRTIPQKQNAYSCITKDSIIQCEEIKSISKARLIQKLGNIDSGDFDIIKKKLKKVFDIL